MVILYFSNGKVYHVDPVDTKNYYDVDIVFSDGASFDLHNIESIRQIPVPAWDDSDSFYGDVTKSLDYILRAKAGCCFSRTEYQLCSALLWKSTELMLSNDQIAWSGDDFRRIINWHLQMNMPISADSAKKYLEQSKRYLSVSSDEATFDTLAKQSFEQILIQANKLGYDYVYFDEPGNSCCASCEKMIGRVFSISGKSMRFPKLPEYTLLHGNFHSGCRCHCTLILDYNPKTIKRHGVDKNALISTFRPHSDFRTKGQKLSYSSFLRSLEQRKLERQRTYEYSKERGMRLAQFEKVKSLCPDLAPNTLTGFSRIRTQKTKRYLQIVERLKSEGCDIDNL